MEIAILTYALDDNHVFLKVLDKHFKNTGINNYRLFADHQQFLSSLSDDVYICIIDHQLKGVFGIDIIRRVKQVRPDCYFIVMSDTNDVDAVIEYVNEGIYKYINKDDKEGAFLKVANWVKDLYPKVENSILRKNNARIIKDLLNRYE
ncbi:hypothetical protein VF04_33930 [Nostoc linckia z7]|uniref:Response regulatory domain-containing protein n=1 Tax=Nostoc linckia z7 TaxID=1628745 RepID=A0ABX4KDX4_NOSLI|nr:response regulator [Nostoc linckia]PHJ59316.1 hypothetical protein VF05_32515 [Nostoc linckia z3]PHJ63641.1 hypothetical protein VF03_30025 [Nostoc linckia z2]PHJ70000.1 hypothetical protein VF06_37785 [Nostoc linckia z4]PHJ88141.1 hypothetical protein VF04_33930 [Nostoc linckia z7]